jgi:G3E family GTPase
MTTSSALASQVLPVSILTGPSTRDLLRDIVASDPNCRFGLLASASEKSDIASGLLVEELAETSSPGGYDPAQIGAQIAAFAEKATVDHLIIECDARTHPISFASLFVPPNGEGPSLSQLTRLSSIVLSIDSDTLLNSLVHGNHASGLTSPCILADQIEVASLVVVMGDSSDADLTLSRAIISAINPRVRIVQRPPKTIPAKLLDAAVSFDFTAATEGAGWRKMIDEAASDRSNGQKGTVTTFAYLARRPFHPEKLWNLLAIGFPGVFRAKGYFWLATRMNVVGGLNIAGSESHYAPAGEWWAALRHRDGSSEIPRRFKKVWMEPFGDRRQAIAFLGIEVDRADLNAHLNACLLNDPEMAAGELGWATLPDPFPAWSTHTHDHVCEDHDCCHH